MCIKVSLFTRAVSMLSGNRVRFPIQNVMATVRYSTEFVRPAFSPIREASMGWVLRRWHTVHVGTVGFRIDRQALRELRSDWPDSTHSYFHDTGDKERIHGVHWLKKDELYVTWERKRNICRFKRLKKDKKLERESSVVLQKIEREKEEKGKKGERNRKVKKF